MRKLYSVLVKTYNVGTLLLNFKREFVFILVLLNHRERERERACMNIKTLKPPHYLRTENFALPHACIIMI